MKEHLVSMSDPMVLALLAAAKTVTRRLVTRSNSLVDGHPATKEQWAELDWHNAWVDPGPSPAGNRGPYWKVPCPRDGTVHRVYSRIQAGDGVAFKEALERGSLATTDHPVVIYSADRKVYQPWGSLSYKHWGWKPSKLAAMYCPRSVVRLISVVVAATPSWPAAVDNADEARREGLAFDSPYRGLEYHEGGWTWRGASEWYPSPLAAYRGLWEKLHGEWTPWAPTWRYEFEVTQ
jgi:hypothetical protein